MKFSPVTVPENGFRKWSLAHHEPVNDDDQPGGAKPNVLSDLSRDGQYPAAVAAKVRAHPGGIPL